MEKNIPDNKNGVPLEHYREKFAAMEPEAMSQRSGFAYADGTFSLRLMGKELRLSHPDMRLYSADGEEITAPATRILLARAVMEGMAKPAGGSYLAYAEVPWGNVYLQQFRGRCIMRLAFGFGFNPDRFDRACRAIGGVPCGGADHAFAVEFLNGLFVKLLLWEGDDEFQPSAQILFSDNFPAMFTAEDMAVVGDTLINALKAADKN